MWDVEHFVAAPKANRPAEPVLHDAEVVLMIDDVGGKLGPVAPADDPLLARARGLPVHFQLELVRLDEPRRLGQPLAERTEEEHEAMRLGPVVAQRRVSGRAGPPGNRAIGERPGVRGVPLLGAGRGVERHHEREQRERQATHEREVTRRLVATASAAALAAGCAGYGDGAGPGVTHADLLALAALIFKHDPSRTLSIMHRYSAQTVFTTCSLAAQGEPTARVSCGRHGDRSVYTTNPRYASPTPLLQALGLKGPGAFLLAAPQ